MDVLFALLIGQIIMKWITAQIQQIVKQSKKQVEIVEKWSKEHPIMTNARKFMEVFGCEPRTGKGSYFCTPKAKRKNDNCSDNCEDCLKWWDKGWEEPEND